MIKQEDIPWGRLLKDSLEMGPNGGIVHREMIVLAEVFMMADRGNE